LGKEMHSPVAETFCPTRKVDFQHKLVLYFNQKHYF
jgi:hypothetical protein